MDCFKIQAKLTWDPDDPKRLCDGAIAFPFIYGDSGFFRNMTLKYRAQRFCREPRDLAGVKALYLTLFVKLPRPTSFFPPQPLPSLSVSLPPTTNSSTETLPFIGLVPFDLIASRTLCMIVRAVPSLMPYLLTT
ncbi:hypothetical protein J2X69_005044 [Algoriphagus sp. 4150]|nr:hypothetical protein [Algoriphagus sp. 4150]